MAKSSKASPILKAITRRLLIITLCSFRAIKEAVEAIAVGCRWTTRATRCRGLRGRWQRAMSTRIGLGLQARLAGTDSSSIRGRKQVVKDNQAIHSRWAGHHLEVRHNRRSVIKTRATTESHMDMLHNITIQLQAIKYFCRRSTRA
jgi:hypothetical protein